MILNHNKKIRNASILTGVFLVVGIILKCYSYPISSLLCLLVSLWFAWDVNTQANRILVFRYMKQYLEVDKEEADDAKINS